MALSHKQAYRRHNSRRYACLLIQFQRMKIQVASVRDLGALRRLENAVFEKDAWSLFDLVAVLTWSDVIRLKAVEDGEMIGFVAGDPRPAQHVGWISHRKLQNGISSTSITLSFTRLLREKVPACSNRSRTLH